MIRKALDNLDLEKTDLILIENGGNLYYLATSTAYGAEGQPSALPRTVPVWGHYDLK